MCARVLTLLEDNSDVIMIAVMAMAKMLVSPTTITSSIIEYPLVVEGDRFFISIELV